MKDKNCLTMCRHKREIISSISTLNRAAFHEAGHALAVVQYGGRLKEIIVNRDGTGCCSHVPLGKAKWKDELKISVAGAMAERYAVHPDWHPIPGWRPSEDEGANNDMQKINEQIQKNMGSTNLDAVNAELNAIIADVFLWLSDLRTWKALEIMAFFLKDNTVQGKNTLAARDANQIAYYLLSY